MGKANIDWHCSNYELPNDAIVVSLQCHEIVLESYYWDMLLLMMMMMMMMMIFDSWHESYQSIVASIGDWTIVYHDPHE